VDRIMSIGMVDLTLCLSIFSFAPLVEQKVRLSKMVRLPRWTHGTKGSKMNEIITKCDNCLKVIDENVRVIMFSDKPLYIRINDKTIRLTNKEFCTKHCLLEYLTKIINKLAE
jgi:hypothetical protein